MASIRSGARKVICIGRNYADHISELQNVRPKQPFFFLKPPSSILPPNSGPVLLPTGVILHYEVELACIIGTPLRDLDPDDEATAINAIDSYCLAIDLTARNIQDEAKRKGLPWTIAKGFDTFLPISEAIPRSEIQDPHAVRLSLEIGGQIRQDDSTALMLFRIPRLMADVSRVMALERGDLLLTGTPRGVGRVKVGDSMRARLRVEGKEIAKIEVGVEDRGGRYVFQET